MDKIPAHQLAAGDVIAEAIGPRAGHELGTVVDVRTSWADDVAEIDLDLVDGTTRTDLVRPTFPVTVLKLAREAAR